MSVEENKKTHMRFNREVWEKQNLANLEEFVCEDFQMGPYSFNGYDDLRKRFTEHFADPEANPVVSVEFHTIGGEGDTLLVWQTNTRKDGSKVEGVTVATYRNGRLANNRWFTPMQPES